MNRSAIFNFLLEDRAEMADSDYSAFGDKIAGEGVVSGRCRVFFDLFDSNSHTSYHMQSTWDKVKHKLPTSNPLSA